MKKIKYFIALVLVCALCFVLCACISESNAIGTWYDSYVYNGNDFSVTLVLNANGQYIKTVVKNGNLSEVKEGNWEVKGGDVCCYTQTGSITYEYTGGKLVNGSQELSKQ